MASANQVTGRASSTRAPLAAIAILSAAALGYEILLMRLFSIVLWHHFAYMMISVALLGYGTAGTFVALARRTLLAHYERAFVAAAALFGVFAVAGFLLAQRVAFDPLELLWDPRQPLRLLAVYGLLVVPFFCAAVALCLTFTRFGERAAWIYGSDLAGAGAGCLAILVALYAIAPADALLLVGTLGLATAAIAALVFRLRAQGIALLAAAIVLPFLVPTDWTRLRASEYKELDRTLQIAGARIVAERSSPLGVVTVVESAQVPFRHAPGLSLAAPAGPPAQLGVFVDGEGPGALTRYDGQREPLAYLDYVTSAVPYHLLARPRVLVLGAGAGADVLQAILHDARAVDAVEQDPQVVDLVERRFADFSGRPYSAPGVKVHIAEARGFVARSRDRYDLIEVALMDAFGAASAGLYALSESYLYTVEAMDAYLDRLAPGGMLAITRWVNLPPRDVLKLFATAAVALERRGVAEPGRQLALIRSWSTATLIVKNGPFDAAQIAALREFSRARSFDADWFPGIAPGEANRFNVLEPSHFEEGAKALLGPERAAFVERYKFALEPSTDDRPYFFRFFRWRTLPEVLALKGRGGLPLLDWSYPVLIATLAQATLVSVVLILLPARDRPAPSGRGADGQTVTRSRRPLLRRDRPCLHVHRDRVHPEVHPVPRASDLRRRRRPRLVSRFRGPRQPCLGAPARRREATATSGDACGGGDRRAVARVSRRAAFALRTPPFAPGRRTDRDLGCAHRTARIRHGRSVPDGNRAPRAGGPGAHPVGVGRERLRVGCRGGRRDRAGDPPGVRRGRRARGRSLRRRRGHLAVSFHRIEWRHRMTKSTLRIGIAGLGRLGKRHATMLAQQVAGAELTAACSPVADELHWARDALGVPHAFSDYDAMLAHPGLDAVFLVTPTTLHADQIIAALRSGKHVFCEKPLALDLADCRRVEDEALRHPRLKAMIGFVRRFDPHYRDARAKIDAGAIGRPFLVRSQCADQNDPGGFFVRYSADVGRHPARHERARHRRARWLLGAGPAKRAVRDRHDRDPRWPRRHQRFRQRRRDRRVRGRRHRDASTRRARSRTGTSR